MVGQGRRINSRFRRVVRLAGACALVGALGAAGGRAVTSPIMWATVSRPIQPTQLTALPFGARSFWLQPWKSSLVVRPARQLLASIGINFNVTPTEAQDTAQLLHDSGFARARIEFGWDDMSYADPSRPANPSALRPYIVAMRRFHIRPLILLNANSEAPAPYLGGTVELTSAAAVGATSIALSPSSVASVTPGLTGFTTPNGDMAGVLVTHIQPDGSATLSRPLPMALPAGKNPVDTLRFAPFEDPDLPHSNTPNPCLHHHPPRVARVCEGDLPVRQERVRVLEFRCGGVERAHVRI